MTSFGRPNAEQQLLRSPDFFATLIVVTLGLNHVFLLSRFPPQQTRPKKDDRLSNWKKSPRSAVLGFRFTVARFIKGQDRGAFYVSYSFCLEGPYYNKTQGD